MNSTDLTLIQAAAKGDHHAFEELVMRYQGLVYSLCFRMLRDSAEAEDAAQEVFVKLWQKLNSYRSGDKLSTWLYSITSNHCLDKLRHQKVQRMYTEAQGINKPVNSTAEQTLQADLTTAIEQLTGRLPEKQRLVFVLAAMEHCSITEIADITNMQKGQVKSNLYYARRQMSALLKQYYSEKLKNDSHGM